MLLCLSCFSICFAADHQASFAYGKIWKAAGTKCLSCRDVFDFLGIFLCIYFPGNYYCIIHLSINLRASFIICLSWNRVGKSLWKKQKTHFMYAFLYALCNDNYQFFFVPIFNELYKNFEWYALITQTSKWCKFIWNVFQRKKKGTLFSTSR